MKKVMILMLSAMMLSGSAMAQVTEQRPPMGQDGRPGMPPGNPPGGMPPGGFGGPGFQQKEIKYAGAKTLKKAATETGKTDHLHNYVESVILKS